VITAKHVVDGAVGISLTDHLNHHASAFLKEAYATDLAVLEVEPQGRAMCDEAAWPGSTDDIASVVQNAGATGKLVKVTAGGSTAQIPVSIVNVDGGQVTVVPDPSMTIAIGWSGSSLYVGDRLAGILVTVDTATGRGSALRSDYCDRVVSDIWPPPGEGSGDPFVTAVRSPEFDSRIHTILESFFANALETLNSGNYVVTTTDTSIESFRSTLQLPGFTAPGTLDFHNNAAYTQRARLDKHPLNLVYTQSFAGLSSTALIKARFDALTAAVGNALPSAWTRNQYASRDEYLNGGMRIVIVSEFGKLQLEFFPKQ